MANLGKIAKQGMGGDSLLGHLTRGEVEIPPAFQTPQVMGLLKSLLGARLPEFTAGSSAEKVNPKTNLPEFDSSSDGGGTGDGSGSGGSNGNNGGPGDGSSGGQGGGNQSSNVSDGRSAVSNTASQTGFSGAVNDVSNAAQSAKTAISAMLDGTNPPDLMGAAKGALLGLASSGPIGMAVGAFTGAAGPGMPSLSGSLASHGVDTGNNPGGTGDPGQSGGGNGGYAGGTTASPNAGLLSALQTPAPAPAPAPTTPAIVPPPLPFWWQRPVARR